MTLRNHHTKQTPHEKLIQCVSGRLSIKYFYTCVDNPKLHHKLMASNCYECLHYNLISLYVNKFGFHFLFYQFLLVYNDMYYYSLSYYMCELFLDNNITLVAFIKLFI